jgi:hypothetical protein
MTRWNSSGIGGFHVCSRLSYAAAAGTALSLPRTRVMTAESTSASSGSITRSLSWSVFDGATDSSGTRSPDDGRRYWTRLWWVILSPPGGRGCDLGGRVEDGDLDAAAARLSSPGPGA